jgi:XRE family aerobic/anaerobic benzoate catabolism transcriptional regulator
MKAKTRKRARPPRTGARDAAYLRGLGERLRDARAQRGMTRLALAHDSGVSLRFLAQLEAGRGNPSLVVLRRIAAALGFAPEALVADAPPRPIDQSLIVQALSRLTPEQLAETRRHLARRYGHGDEGRGDTVCLVGLRGAGKTTLGRRLARHEGVPFIELDREVERELGATMGEILALHGQPGYRRTEAECLAAVLARHPHAVIETGGGFAIEPASLELLLGRTRMVWVKASPEEHMQRVVDQGDLRPMAKNRAAMADLRRILRVREPFYRQAPLHLDTSRRTVEQSFRALVALLRR